MTDPLSSRTSRSAWLRDLWLDLRFGVRALRRSPGFLLATAGTLALGLGGAAAIFSLVSTILINPLGNEGGDRLVVLTQDLTVSRRGLGFSPTELDDYRRELGSVEAVVEHHTMTFNLLGEGEPREVTTGVVDDRYFAAMGIRPLMGRFFTAEENAAVGNAVLVLSHRYWRDQLGADPAIVGRRFVMNGLTHTVVGVLPPIAQFPTGNDIYVPTSQCPVRSSAGVRSNRGARLTTALARLAPGVTMARFRAELDLASSRIQRANPEAYPAGSGYGITATPIKTALIGDATRPLLLLLGATGLVLLIATSNVAGLQLARLASREQELAVRISLGAGIGRIARQLVAESTLISLLGGAIGIVLAAQAMAPLRAFTLRFTTRAAEAGIGLPVIGFGLALSLVTGLVVGAAATLSTRKRATAALRRGIGTSFDRSRQRMLSAGVVIQLSFAFVMLVGAGLLVRSLWLVSRVDPGFAVDHVITMRVVTPVGSYGGPDAQRGLWTPVLEGLRSRPGVIAAGVGTNLPLSGASTFPIPFEIRGREASPTGDRPLAQVRIADPGYFQALQIPIKSGRSFDDRDQPASEQIAIVNEAFVRRYLGSDDPLGAVLIPCDSQNRCLDANAVRIVGVAGDVATDGLDVAPQPAVYGPGLQSGTFGQNLVVRTERDPTAVAKVAIELVRRVDANLPVEDVQTMAAVRAESLAPRQVMATLLALFAGLAVAVSTAGVIAMTAFVVTQREREIGIRLALGARSGTVISLISGFAIRAVVAGLVIGGTVAAVLNRSVAGLVWGIGSLDPATYLGAAAAITAGTALAAWAAARRAGRIDPVALIRS